eukprot:5380349-Pleurochrysis_carterae.AAC.6
MVTKSKCVKYSELRSELTKSSTCETACSLVWDEFRRLSNGTCASCRHKHLCASASIRNKLEWHAELFLGLARMLRHQADRHLGKNSGLHNQVPFVAAGGP